MARARAEEGGSADMTTPIGRVRLRGRIPPSWRFIVAAPGLFVTIALAIRAAVRPPRVLATSGPPCLCHG
jgi:hypothetical protein